MFKSILKTVLIACLLVVLPILLLILTFTLGLALPLIGICMIVFLPMVIVGVIIGYNERKKGEKKEG